MTTRHASPPENPQSISLLVCTIRLRQLSGPVMLSYVFFSHLPFFSLLSPLSSHSKIIIIIIIIQSFASKIHTPLKCTFCGTCQPSSQSALFLFYTVLLYD